MNDLSKPLRIAIKSLLITTIVVIAIIVGAIIYFSIFSTRPYSAATICINNLRNIDLAKNVWALKYNKATNEIPTWDDIKPFFDRGQPFYKFNATNNLPMCPSGGTYTIGKIGENPKCSLGTNNFLHALP